MVTRDHVLRRTPQRAERPARIVPRMFLQRKNKHKDLTAFGCQVGFPIRKSADQSLFAAPHGLSQRITSFIASYRQGIHQTPFLRLIRSRRRKTVLDHLRWTKI